MTLLCAFNRQCDQAPERTACSEGDRRLSYRELRQRAQKLGTVLSKRPEPCRRVAIALDRGIDAAVAILAVLGIGACYVPLDLNNPPGRLQTILADAAAQCVIGRGPCPDWVLSTSLWLDIETLPTSAPAADTWPAAAPAETLAVILYTSGSTGTPKGVALSHRALRNFADWAAAAFKLVADDRIASLAPFHFDLSVFDLFSGLSAGATVHFVPTGLTLAPSRLTAWLSARHISIFYTVPSLLGFIALKGALPVTPLPDLRTVLFAGEVFPTSQLQKLCGLLPQVEFYNLYGPTETNVCCYWPVDRKRLETGKPIPIGFPACGALLKIDEASGELLVQSANNLSGYWLQGRLVPALTTDYFYPTGDRVSRNENGEYCYHGRLDRLLKCSGYRVEPAEIEAAIMQCSDVVACAVVGVRDAAGGKRPAAAVMLKAGADLREIIGLTRQRLPAYMRPGKMIALDSLPRLANGKTDYRALQQHLEDFV